MTGCERKWCSYNGSCYLFNASQALANFQVAKRTCELRGAYLTEIQSLAENIFLAGLVTEQIFVLIGYHKNQAGQWLWTNTNAAGTFTNWPYTRTDSKMGCAGLKAYDNHQWSKLPCDGKWKYVCEKGAVK